MKIFLNILILNLVCINSWANAQTGPPKSIKSVEFEVMKVYGLNSEYAEFSPVRFQSEIVFASDRIYDFNSIGEDNWSKTKHINLFSAELKMETKDSVVFSEIKLFDDNFLDDDHSGPICFTQDGKKAIYSKVTHRKQKLFGAHLVRPQLYETNLVDGKWSGMEKLSFVKESNTYGHPSISGDGKTLYYVSDEFGGKGGKDLFVVSWENGEWSEPVALNILNSVGDELFPSIQGDKLYFSSNGLGGEGGLDLFVTELKDGNWTAPVNLGSTINSTFDDFGIVLNPNKETGFFSSNRDSGAGEDDIYFFNRIETLTVEDNSMAGQFTYRYLEGSPSKMEVLLVDEDGNIVDRTTTKEDGTFKFRNLVPGQKYLVRKGESGEDVELQIYGKDASAFLLSNDDGEFVYRKLSPNKRGTLSLMDLNDLDEDGLGELNGQLVYTKLQNSSPASIEVYLVDEDGNIVETTTTDKNGNFKFEKLSASNNYSIKTAALDQDAELYVYNKKDLITAVLAANTNGEFVYRKLDGTTTGLELLNVAEDELVFRDKMMYLSGEFKYRSLDEVMRLVEYEIFDKDGVLIMNSVSDDKGFFRHTSLRDMETMKFKIDGVKYTDDVDLILKDKNKLFIIRLDKDKEGYFVYEKLKNSSGSLQISESEMVALLKKDGLSGFFEYENLESTAQFLEYELYDEDGNLLKAAKTNKDGYFSHPDLAKNGNYKFKMLNGTANRLRVLASDEDDRLILLNRDDNDVFVYERLNNSMANINVSNIEDEEMKFAIANGKSMDNLYYDNNEYKLTSNAKKQLETVISKMKQDPNINIAVISHTSSVGSDSYNVKLSEKRMEAVIEYMISKGISSSKINGKYFGDKELVIDCNTKECTEDEEAKNRRTELRFITE
jgi:outer membrane protein OmpA-like peptidoglycan-associated protein